MKGEAANILRRLGIKASVGQILAKFQTTYGQIDTPESISKKFYACQQEENETYNTYAARVEELFAQAVEMNAMKSTNEKILMNHYQGMAQPLKQLANLKFDTIKHYDKFKIEVRK